MAAATFRHLVGRWRLAAGVRVRTAPPARRHWGPRKRRRTIRLADHRHRRCLRRCEAM